MPTRSGKRYLIWRPGDLCDYCPGNPRFYSHKNFDYKCSSCWEYSVKNISVNAGSWVRINLINKGVDPAMIHNILIVNYNKRSEVATAALEAGQELDYIPKSKDVIAGSKQANPGETVTLEFKAPAKGNYEFFCSYPGHSGKMRGYFFVK